MREGFLQWLLSRRPRRRVRRVASLEGKLPRRGRTAVDPNPQTPFVLSATSVRKLRRTRTTVVVDLTADDQLASEREATDHLVDDPDR